jgi:shikimate dehydrogenase
MHYVRHAHEIEVIMSTLVPNGRTCILSIIGHPVTQVRSPEAVNRELARRRIDAVMIAVDIVPEGLAGFFDFLRSWRNAAGAVVTVPHKIAAVTHLDTMTERASLLGAVNMVRRGADGRLHGDMVDGDGFMAAMTSEGVSAKGKTVAIFGAGAVGRALSLAFAQADAARITLHEPDAARADAFMSFARDAGIAGLVSLDAARRYGEADIAINASPCGMNASDPLPFDPTRLAPTAYVADVVTEPELTPLLAAARERGLTIQVGRAMAEAQRDLQIAFFGLDRP